MTYWNFQRHSPEHSQSATMPSINTRILSEVPISFPSIEKQDDDGEPFEDKMVRLTGVLSEMFKRSHELEDEIRKKLGAIGYEI